MSRTCGYQMVPRGLPHHSSQRGGAWDLMVASILCYSGGRACAQMNEDGMLDLMRTFTTEVHEGLSSDEEEERRRGLGSGSKGVPVVFWR